jgi:hypothetical protein
LLKDGFYKVEDREQRAIYLVIKYRNTEENIEIYKNKENILNE